MATTTVRLDADDEQLLDQLSEIYGGRSNTIRQALRQLSAQAGRRQALTELLDDWTAEFGPVDEAAVAAAAERYGL